MEVEELHDTFRSTFGKDTGVMDKQWLKRQIQFGVQNLCKVDHVSSLVDSGLPLLENEDNSILIPGSNLCERVHTFSTDVHGRKTLIFGRGVEKCEDSQAAVTELSVVGPGLGALNTGLVETEVISNKRSRKPTQRYIDNISERKSKCHKKSLKASLISSTGDLPSVYQKYHVPSDHPRKITSIVDSGGEVNMLYSISPKSSSPQHSESESLDFISDDCATEINSKKIGVRRNQHRVWALAEVEKLVSGVSLYGVGRWSEIKRQIFPTSAYRTSVDLKDKWRNLLRACVVQLDVKKKGCTTPSIPHSILERVRVLDAIHSYPRAQKLTPRQVSASPLTVKKTSSSTPADSPAEAP